MKVLNALSTKYLRRFTKLFQNQFILKQEHTAGSAEIQSNGNSTLKWLEEQGDMKDNWIYVNNCHLLPKLPVPPLEQTIRKYEEKMKVLLNKDEYSNFLKITKKFVEDQNLGPKLQNFLLDRQEKLDNWAYDYWIDDMYLARNDPLPIYTNPGIIKTTYIKDIYCFGAHIVTIAVMMESLIKLNVFPEGKYLKAINLQLCMEQYFKFFSSGRIPGKEKDYTSVFNYEDKKHIIVIYQNSFYYVPIKILNNRVDTSAIYSSLKSIINSDKNQTSPPVGILTTLERRECLETRNNLIKYPVNEENLKLIEKALLILCFDKSTQDNLTKTNSDYCLGMLLKKIIHGGGVNENSGNRWFDKSLQVFLAESHMGFCVEHSLFDGITSNFVGAELFNKALKDLNSGTCKYNEKDAEFLKLNWILDDEALANINYASLKFDRLIKDFDLRIWHFNEYGSKFIKSHKYSPDGFVQLIFQLTYYKLYGKLCVTYESGSTRRFKRGRIDCIRSTTPEAFEWVKEMVKPQTSNAVKLKLWKSATNAQYKEIKDVISGHGIDIHLLGLREAAKEVLDEIPELFTDESYAIANKFILSTSQINNFENGVVGFGPVTFDGYGVLYAVKNSHIIFTISSFYSCKTTSTEKYLDELKQSFYDVRAMIEHAE